MPPFSRTFGAAGSRRTSHFPRTKALRCPDHITYASSLADESILRGLVCKHVCKHPTTDAEGQQQDCSHRLHGADVPEAVEHLRRTRQGYLKKSFGQRREFLYGLTRSRPGSSSGPRAIVDFLMTGASGDVRLVCRPVVRAAYPHSDRTLDRICKRRRMNVGAHALCAGRTFIDSEKKQEAIGWWLAYADVELIECIFDYAGWLAPHLYESSWRPEVSERTTSFRHLLPSPAQRSSRERSRSRWS